MSGTPRASFRVVMKACAKWSGKFPVLKLVRMFEVTDTRGSPFFVSVCPFTSDTPSSCEDSFNKYISSLDQHLSLNREPMAQASDFPDCRLHSKGRNCGNSHEETEMPKPDSFIQGMKDVVKEYTTSAEAAYMPVEVEGFMLPKPGLETMNLVPSFEVRSDDIYVCSYPKAGTTWLQNVVFLVLYGSGSAHSEKRVIEERFPYLENIIPGIPVINKMPSPRLIKSHLPMSLLPKEITTKKPKILYITRNPKDVVVSYNFFYRMLKPVNYNGTVDDWVQLFVEDKTPYSPWAEHVTQYWDRRDDENLLFLTYEEMSRDLLSCVRKVAAFLGKNLPEEEIQAISRECGFSAMKKNDTTNYTWWTKIGLRKPGEAEFMRKGKVGDWKNHPTPEMSEKIDKMVEEKITPLGLKVEFELEDNK